MTRHISKKGKETQVFSKEENKQAQIVLQDYVLQNQKDGYITNHQTRRILGFVNSKSEQVQVSRIFREWVKEGFIEKGSKRGLWKIKTIKDE